MTWRAESRLLPELLTEEYMDQTKITMHLNKSISLLVLIRMVRGCIYSVILFRCSKIGFGIPLTENRVFVQGPGGLWDNVCMYQ